MDARWRASEELKVVMEASVWRKQARDVCDISQLRVEEEWMKTNFWERINNSIQIKIEIK